MEIIPLFHGKEQGKKRIFSDFLSFFPRITDYGKRRPPQHAAGAVSSVYSGTEPYSSRSV